MVTLHQVTQCLFGANLGVSSVHSDGKLLVVRSGTKETHINNWETLNLESIEQSVRGSSINEKNHSNKVLLNE